MNGIAFTVSLALFIGGIALFAYAIETPGLEFIMFTGGILAVVVSIAIPFHVLKRTDG